MPLSDNQALQNVYRAFDPQLPLQPDQTDLYVNLDEVRGDADVVKQLGAKIRLAERPTHQVLAGHRGSGKSTELLRLKRELETADPKLLVVLCKADEDVDRNDVDFPDILVAIVRQMAAQVRERAGIKLKPGYFKDRWERLKKLLGTEISFDEFEVGEGLLKLSGAIKSSPDAREKIRALFEPDTDNWLVAANEAIGQAVMELAKKGYAGLVILVDDLDKMVVRTRPNESISTAAHLFVNRAAQLAAFKCHVVYTMPISLAYSSYEPTIKSSFDGHIPVISMTRIANRPPNDSPFQPGIKKFREIVEARLKLLGLKRGDLFKTDAVCTELIRLSGGQPRELMTLVREALIAQGMPIDASSLKRVRIAGQREYARQLLAEHWPIIDTVRKTGNFNRTKDNEQAFWELLESRAILQYVNNVEWYGLNPMVAALESPLAQRSKRSGRRG